MKRVLLTIIAALALGTTQADAGPPGACACSSAPRYRCRLVCTMKSELSYELTSVCEPYCQLGPSDNCGKKKVCDDSFFGFHWETIWKPNCDCKVRNKTTLVKVPVVKKVPVYTCVVERVCGQCGNCHRDEVATQRLRDAGIMPVSAESPLVELDETLRPIPATEDRSAASAIFAAPAVPQRETIDAR